MERTLQKMKMAELRENRKRLEGNWKQWRNEISQQRKEIRRAWIEPE